MILLTDRRDMTGDRCSGPGRITDGLVGIGVIAERVTTRVQALRQLREAAGKGRDPRAANSAEWYGRR